MREMYERLGIQSNASPEMVKKAYKDLARKNHPDKPGGSLENMQKLNEAYRLLNNPEELKKYFAEHADEDSSVSSIFLNSSGERPSEAYRRSMKSLTKFYLSQPTKVLKKLNPEDAFINLNNPSKRLMAEEYYINLYRVKDSGVPYSDLFEYLNYMSNWSIDSVSLPAKFFQEPLTLKKGLIILEDFLAGNYYGKKLELIQSYLLSRLNVLEETTYDAVVFKALITIISSTSFVDNHKEILEAVEQIYKYIYQTRSMEKPEFLALIQNKYFRYLIASALKQNWQDPFFSGPKEVLLSIKSDFAYLARIASMYQAHSSIEKKIQSLFSKNPTAEESYECGYVALDMMACVDTSVSTANYALIAALCFHYAASIEREPSKTMAAEYIALILYQAALKCGFRANVMLGLYMANQIIKCLGTLCYEQSTLDFENLVTHILNPGDMITQVL